ncbi:MaoC family dehydratase [Nocardioides sp. zg-ZUI104]|uniref:MaoC family dehydratase n=1 Tax=Nocardioides faecalis TaxID=2803858 RepID=UPI001BCEED8C|nr:MaoC family dehydratase [Nocardioides faecalis]MBS4754567.1 MaoC family dehydratase [Nocardioides faecalis]
MTIHVRQGFFFEDIEVGDIVRHRPGRTIGESDNLLFAALSMNRQSLHFDAVAAEDGPFGERVVIGSLTLAVTVGLAAADLTEGTGVANLGYDRVRFPAAVLVGDTIRSETEFIDKRLSSSRPGVGVVTLEHRGLNQRDEVVCLARRVAMFRCRERDES